MDSNDDDDGDEHDDDGDRVIRVTSDTDRSRNKTPPTPKSPPKLPSASPKPRTNNISSSYWKNDMSQPTEEVDHEEGQEEEEATTATATTTTDDVYDILYPTSLERGEVTLLVQIDPQDAATLDLEGATGAIGRLETDAHGRQGGVILDLKGCQYHGTLFPGPTAMVLSLPKKKTAMSSSLATASSSSAAADSAPAMAPVVKIDALTDEFVRLAKTQGGKTTLEKLHATVQGRVDDSFYSDDDNDDVNRTTNATTSSKKNKTNAASSLSKDNIPDGADTTKAAVNKTKSSMTLSSSKPKATASRKRTNQNTRDAAPGPGKKRKTSIKTKK